jgi:hypothetical protein
MQIGKARHPKIYVVIGKMKNEDSRGLRIQREEFFFQVPRHLILKQTPKQAKKTGISVQNLHRNA